MVAMPRWTRAVPWAISIVLVSALLVSAQAARSPSCTR